MKLILEKDKIPGYYLENGADKALQREEVVLAFGNNILYYTMQTEKELGIEEIEIGNSVDIQHTNLGEIEVTKQPHSISEDGMLKLVALIQKAQEIPT